ncbi:MAG: twin arginine-targeting protein translocase TatB [Beggiatoa sp. IS2]|nr:MAG: twin arginine-targeting protein translocase TatB [Beggiatoa sp. IS2]
MFDVGFFELCLVALVALLVFGPEKLPEVTRSAGLWVGRFRRFIVTVKQDVDRELRLQELQESMKLEERNHLYQFLEKDVNSLDSNSSTDAPADTIPTLLSNSNTLTNDDPLRPTT